jgi:DNA-directed RNA polymerase alpha subunit
MTNAAMTNVVMTNEDEVLQRDGKLRIASRFERARLFSRAVSRANQPRLQPLGNDAGIESFS